MKYRDKMFYVRFKKTLFPPDNKFLVSILISYKIFRCIFKHIYNFDGLNFFLKQLILLMPVHLLMLIVIVSSVCNFIVFNMYNNNVFLCMCQFLTYVSSVLF